MEITRLWPLAGQAAQVVSSFYEPVIPGLVTQFGIDIPVLFDCLLAAKIFEPDPITVERWRVRAPYSSPKRYAKRLAKAAAGGFFRPVGQEGYVLAEKGNQAIKAAIQAIYSCLAKGSPLPPEKLVRLAGLLGKLVEASMAAPEPPGHWCLAHSRNLDPGKEAAVMVKIDQYLSDLAAYRDDAHLASWRDCGVDGPAWDALTCLWRQSPLTLDEIFTRLRQRGWDPSDYTVRLEEMVRKGWVEQKANKFSILPAGRDVRQAAESLTDEYFYRPWQCLSDKELNTLEKLLNEVDNWVKREDS